MRHPSRVLAAGLLGLTFTAGSAFAVVSPVSASASVCIAYLEDEGLQSTARNLVCEAAEAAGDTVSIEAAEALCVPVMVATVLPLDNAQAACDLAVAP